MIYAQHFHIVNSFCISCGSAGQLSVAKYKAHIAKVVGKLVLLVSGATGDYLPVEVGIAQRLASRSAYSRFVGAEVERFQRGTRTQMWVLVSRYVL